MKVTAAIAHILKTEGVEYLPCFPRNSIIDATAAVGIRPIVCRQERVGMGIADGFSRVSNGCPPGVFAMQFGPGAENAYSGVATAYSDSVPVLVLPMGHARSRAGILPHFNSVSSFRSIAKSVEAINAGDRVVDVMRRAFSSLKMGRPGPVLVEVPVDVAEEEVGESAMAYRPIEPAKATADPRDVEEVARVLVEARNPVIQAGQGVLYAGASENLEQLADLLQVPVMTTIAGKSAFPEEHPLSLGTGAATIAGPVVHFVSKADVVFGVGTSLTRHGVTSTLPSGKTLIQATNDPRDINKDYPVDYPIIGDANLVLGQIIEAVEDRLGGKTRNATAVAQEIEMVRAKWLAGWMPKLTSGEVPINPYRIIWELMATVDPSQAIVTHDSGSPRDQMVPFYRSAGPRSFLGWGKSHGLGTGLGLAIGAKLAAPDKLAVYWMGDAAFGMVGLDFETAVRCSLPIMALVSNNSTMAGETKAMPISQEHYGARNLGGNYADMARAMGGYAERVEDPGEIRHAIQRAIRATEEGIPALVEFITCAETASSHKRAFG